MCQYCLIYSQAIGNLTDINQIAPIFHKTFYIPGILVIFVFYSLITLILGISAISNHLGRKKFFGIWFISTILATSLIILIIFKPSIIAFIVDLFRTNQ